MTVSPLHRRSLLAGLVGAGVSTPFVAATAAPRSSERSKGKVAVASELGLVPDLSGDQTAAFQMAVDQAALHGVRLELPPGRYRIEGGVLRAGSHLVGSPRSVLVSAQGGAILTAESANRVRVEKLQFEGTASRQGPAVQQGLLEFTTCGGLALEGLTVSRAAGNGLVVKGSSGRIASCVIEHAGRAGIFSLDAAGLDITGNTVSACADNGILVWRSAAGEDETLVAHNRIAGIGAASGGSGQNGNGINVFRAGSVRVIGNSITDCAYSAIRGNAASNIQMSANTATRIGEVALYSEFGFEGAIISQNIVDRAATGISVTNFNEGGRLAVIQGNLVRNLFRREHEPQDKRGEGISVEADATVSANTVEGAPTAGIVVGWSRFMRDVAVTGNLIRSSRIGIAITADPHAGGCLVAQNVIASAREGAIRQMDLDRPVGEDLLRAPSRSQRLVIANNVATPGT